MKALLLLAAGWCSAAELNLTRCVVIYPSTFSGPEKKAVAMLLD